jgi:hypothetical protein
MTAATFAVSDVGDLWADVTTAHGPWRGYTFRVSFDAEGATTSLLIQRGPKTEVLTARHMQAVPFGAVENVARVAVQRARSTHQTEPSVPSRRPYGPDVRLARFALRYVETLGQTDQIATLSSEFHMRPETVPNAIQKARRRGFLTGTVHGRVGGFLTERAEQLIPGAPPEDPGIFHNPV